MGRYRSSCALLLAAAVFAFLVTPTGAAAAGLADRLGEGVEVARQDEGGKVGFIGTSPGQPVETHAPASQPPRALAVGFVEDHARAFGLGGPGDTVRVVESRLTLGGETAVRLRQIDHGVPVLGGELVVNLTPGGDVRSVLGETTPSPEVAAAPAVGAGDAAEAAIGAVAKAQGLDVHALTASNPRLHVYDPALLGAPDPIAAERLAWVLEVSTDGPASVRELAVVDAASGVVALHFDQIAEAKNRSVCDANNTPAQYPCTSPVWTEGNTPGGVDGDVPSAYDFAGDTYDFFFNRFGRDSIDGGGIPLISTVDYCDPNSPCPYENAFWDGSQMVYGDGFASADDVVGHELTHGVTEFSSHLFYYYQSGAINESMSDVFGELVDLTNGAGSDAPADRWLLGEDLPSSFNVCGADPHILRNMADPPDCGDPDRMTSPNYTADPNEADAGGVHSNSGVNNKAAFLITDGETFNGQTIAGLGVDKAARIYYEVNNSVLTSASDYADLGNALNQACTNLIGTGGITAADCTEVSQAVLATEMATDPPNAPAPEAPSPAATCTGGTTPTTLFFDDLENTASGNWVTAADDPPAYGGSAWFYPQNPNVYAEWDPTYATSGETNFWGDDPASRSDSTIAMTSSVTVPANAFLRFEHAYGFEDSATRAYDGGVVEYSTDGGSSWVDAGPLFDYNGYDGTLTTISNNPLEGREAFIRESNGYISSRADLSSLAGQSVRFRFRIGSDSSVLDYGWFVDDIRIFACQGGSAPAAVICASNLDGDPNIPGRQCPNGFEYGNDNPAYAFGNGGVRVKLAPGTEAAFLFTGGPNINCNKSNGSGRISDSGAGDGVPTGFLFDIDWQERTGGVVSEQCPTNLAGATANGEPIETNGATPGIWSFTANWTADGAGMNGTMTLLDVRASVDISPPVSATCFLDGDTDGDGLNEGDRALELDLDNPSNVLVSDWLVEPAPQSGSCPDQVIFEARYFLKGNTDNDGDPKLDDNLFIRQDDA